MKKTKISLAVMEGTKEAMKEAVTKDRFGSVSAWIRALIEAALDRRQIKFPRYHDDRAETSGYNGFKPKLLSAKYNGGNKEKRQIREKSRFED